MRSAPRAPAERLTRERAARQVADDRRSRGAARARDEREKREALEEEKALALRQLEELRKSYAILQQEHELLRRRIFAAKAERVDPTQLELEFEKTKAALDEVRRKLEAAAQAAGVIEPPAPPSLPQSKRKPRGRRKLDDASLPIEKVVLPDPEMQALVERGEAEIIGADVSSTLKYRRGSMVRFVTEKPTYRVIKNADGTETTLVTAAMPPTIIERSIGTPSLYAHIATDKFDRGLPLYRQEEEFADLGVSLDRGTMSRWLEELGGTLGATILHVMRIEALTKAMCLSTDATGILVQQGRDRKSKSRRPCKKGHYFVQIADRDAVFFEYTERETSAAVLEMFRGFSGYVQADAKSVFDILFREPDEPPDPDIEPDPSLRREIGCLAHARRYFFEAAAVAKEPVAREALFRLRRLFEMDAKWKDLPPSKRKLMRDQFLAPELDAFFAFVHAEWEKVKGQRGLLRSALGYARNHEAALKRFLEDGRLKLDNNASERALRRIAIGRKNWLFVGSDIHAVSTANLMSMIASAKLHDLDPEEYLRDIFRILPHWPEDRYLELAPKYWLATRERLDPVELEQEIGWLKIPPPLAG
ncbi:MAG: IS66 family transposase [Sandaracinaceae bacterium]|nr:IS66 family transposase [Sandaracinaceae bacterium]